VQDTVYFWVFPWKEVLTALVGVLVLAIIGTYIVHMRAMARPVPAPVRSAARSQVLSRETTVSEPAYDSAQPMMPPAPQQATQQTVLAGRRTATQPQRMSTSRAPSANTSTRRSLQEQVTQGAVTLAPHQTGGVRAVRNGSTVQLRPRR
jgi:uncharacterized membrane protein